MWIASSTSHWNKKPAKNPIKNPLSWVFLCPGTVWLHAATFFVLYPTIMTFIQSCRRWQRLNGKDEISGVCGLFESLTRTDIRGGLFQIAGAAEQKPRAPKKMLQRVTERRLIGADRGVLHGVCHWTRFARYGGLPVYIALWVIVAVLNLIRSWTGNQCSWLNVARLQVRLIFLCNIVHVKYSLWHHQYVIDKHDGFDGLGNWTVAEPTSFSCGSEGWTHCRYHRYIIEIYSIGVVYSLDVVGSEMKWSTF